MFFPHFPGKGWMLCGACELLPNTVWCQEHFHQCGRKPLIWNHFVNMWCLKSINHRSCKFKMWEYIAVQSPSRAFDLSKQKQKDCWLKIVLRFITRPKRRWHDIMMKTLGRFDDHVACTNPRSDLFANVNTKQFAKCLR